MKFKYKKGQRFRTQDGRTAFFISYEPKLERPLVFRVGDQIWTRQKDGKHCNTCDGSVYPEIYINKAAKEPK